MSQPNVVALTRRDAPQPPKNKAPGTQTPGGKNYVPLSLLPQDKGTLNLCIRNAQRWRRDAQALFDEADPTEQTLRKQLLSNILALQKEEIRLKEARGRILVSEAAPSATDDDTDLFE